VSTLRTAYTLAPGEFDAARAALHKALETFRVSKAEERLFKGLRLCLWITSGAFGLAVALLIFFDVTQEGATLIALGFSSLTSLAGAFLVLVLLLLNWRLVRNAVRQWLLLKRLGLEEASRTAWKAKHRRAFLDRLSSRIGKAILGVVVFFAFVFMAVAVSMGEWLNVAVGLLALVVAFTFPVWRFVERMRQRLTLALDAQHALNALDGTGASGDSIVVPAAVLEQAARIEHAQIAADRARAIAAKAAESRGYALLTTREVTGQKAALPAAQRLDLEDLIEEVVASPTAWPAGVEAGGSLRRARTADGAIEIDYEIDEPARTIRIVGCRGIGAPAVGV
jgi:hypothetical protein